LVVVMKVENTGHDHTYSHALEKVVKGRCDEKSGDDESREHQA
jgi:hypothetical protein